MSHDDSTSLLLVSGDEANFSISLLLNQIARPNASTLPSRKFASPSKVRGSQWGGVFYGYRLKFWLFYGYRFIFCSYG